MDQPTPLLAICDRAHSGGSSPSLSNIDELSDMDGESSSSVTSNLADHVYDIAVELGAYHTAVNREMLKKLALSQAPGWEGISEAIDETI